MQEKDVNRLLAGRVARRSTRAVPHSDKIIKGLESRTEAFNTEISRLREALDGAAFIESASGTSLADAYLDDLDFETRELLDERQKLLAEWNLLRPAGPVRTNDRIAQAQRYIEQAMLERGADRGVLLREARTALNEVANSQAVVHPILWLAQGWATWQMNDHHGDAVPMLEKVDAHPVPSVACSIAYRLLAYFSLMDEMPVKALEYAQKAVQARETPESCIDLAMMASTMHDPQTAKAYYEKAFTLRPGSIIGALSDDRCLTTGTELLEVAVRVQLNLRREGRQAVTAWVASARQVSEAQKACPGGLHMPHDLMEGHKHTLQRLEDCDLIIGGYLTRFSRECSFEVGDYARKSLQAEFVKRCDAVSLARRSITNAAAWRENRLRSAKTEREEMEKRAKATLDQFDAETERSEKASLFGFGAGCALFGLYIVSFMILEGRGVEIGITTPVGLIATGISAVPILVAIGMQAAHALKRLSMEGQVQDALRATKAAGERTAADVDDEYRDQLKHHRKTLAIADAELKKVESAMRCLGLKAESPVEEASEDGAEIDGSEDGEMPALVEVEGGLDISDDSSTETVELEEPGIEEPAA